MTAANRRSLMNRELQILRDLVTVAHPKPPNSCICDLLDKKTINRTDSVFRIGYYGHIQRRRSDSLLQKAKGYRLTLKRRVGRPRFTYKRTLMEDMRKYPNIAQPEWDVAMQHVEELKRMTSTLYSRQDYDDDPLSADLMLCSPDEAD